MPQNPAQRPRHSRIKFDVIDYATPTGAIPPEGAKPKGADYDDATKPMIRQAIAMYSERILFDHSFRKEDLTKAWSQKDWRDTCDEFDKRFGTSDNDRALKRWCIINLRDLPLLTIFNADTRTRMHNPRSYQG